MKRCLQIEHLNFRSGKFENHSINKNPCKYTNKYLPNIFPVYKRPRLETNSFEMSLTILPAWVQRSTTTPLVMSVYSIIEFVCGLERNNARLYYIRLLEKDDTKDELLSFCRTQKIDGRGKETPVVDAHGSMQLIMMLRGKNASIFRKAAADLVTRYFAGDVTLAQEVQHMAQTSFPGKDFFVDSVNQHRREEEAVPDRKRVRTDFGTHGMYKTTYQMLMDMVSRCKDTSSDIRLRYFQPNAYVNMFCTKAVTGFAPRDIVNMTGVHKDRVRDLFNPHHEALIVVVQQDIIASLEKFVNGGLTFALFEVIVKETFDFYDDMRRKRHPEKFILHPKLPLLE